jgi:DNA invertase Pin-like site-specific DNA recombinase
MKMTGIALHRISSAKQQDGHSIEAQELSTRQMAESMGIEIVESWSITQSSKAGKNASRKDLIQILKFLKSNKDVKYFFIDRVDRLMREMKQMVAYIVQLDELGVKLIFCDDSQRYLNSDNQMNQLLLIIEGFRAEQDNKGRTDTTTARMISRYKEGYYLSHPRPGYKASSIPGLHEPDEPRFSLLQKGSRFIIYDQYTVPQAVRWMNDNGYRTIGGNKLDVNKFINFISKRYYCGIIEVIKDGPLSGVKNVKGNHINMFSKREHELLLGIISKRNPRIRRQHNPEFPLGNILRHEECLDGGGYEKFTGYYHDKGKRPNGSQRNRKPVYACRDCRKRISRNKVHQSFTEFLDSLEFIPNTSHFRKALLKVWKQQRGTVQQRANALVNQKEILEHTIIETAKTYSQESEGATKNALSLLLKDYDIQHKDLLAEIASTNDIELESEEFLKFAFDFVDKIKSKWWDLMWDDQKRGEQILFNGKIYANNSANVHTPSLSTIYRLGTNKKALSDVDNAHLVELQGTAPWSAGLSLANRLQA